MGSSNLSANQCFFDTDTTVIDHFKPDSQINTEAVLLPVQSHTYALRVLGDSMASEAAASFPDGSIIIVDPEMQALPGDYVIARNGDSQTTFKQLIKNGSDFFLKPLNPLYPIRPLGSTTIIGVVRECAKRFR